VRTPSVFVAKDACELPLSAPVPIALPPSLNVTVPLGGCGPDEPGVTVAVRFTVVPYPAVGGLAARVVVVAIVLTVCVNVPVLVWKAPSELV